MFSHFGHILKIVKNHFISEKDLEKKPSYFAQINNNIYKNVFLLYFESLPTTSQISFELIKFLIENKSALDFKSKDYSSAIHFAVKNANLTPPTLQYILENKATVNACNGSKETALTKALQVEKISIDIIKILIENKTDLNLSSKDSSNLHHAARNTSVTSQIIHLLVDNKADLNFIDKNKKLPLHFACENENVSPDLFRFFVDNSAFNSKVINPLITLFQMKNIPIEKVKILCNIFFYFNIIFYFYFFIFYFFPIYFLKLRKKEM